jgi:outer membrane immunogenic protein
VRAQQIAIFTVCAAACMLAFSHCAQATDLALPAPKVKAPVRTPAPAPGPSWTGFYLGGEVGFDGAAAKHTSVQFGGPNPPDTWIGSVNRGPVWGAYAGVNYQALPWLVLGAEGAWSTSRTSYREFGPDFDSLEASKFVASVAGRLGFVIMPTTMVYAKAGPAWMDARGINGFGDEFTSTLRAVMLGVGVESLLTPNVAVRLEGTYTHATETLVLNDGADEFRPNIMQVMVGAAYKLDVPGLMAAAPAGGSFWTKAPPLLTKAPPVAATTKWTGVEVGGFVSVNDDQMQFFGPTAVENDEQGPYANFRVGGGAFIGLNGQFGNVVLGAEVSANFQKADFNESNSVGTSFFHFASIDNVYAASLRVGFLVTPDTLVYAKGGPAWIRVTPDMDYYSAINPVNSGIGTVTITGYQYGGGIETYLSQYFSLRVEGVYTASLPGAGELTFQGLQPTPPFQLKPSLLSGTLGAAVHF